MQNRLLSKKDLASYLGISERTVDRLRCMGKLRAIKVGRGVRFDPAAVEASTHKYKEKA